MPIALMLLVSLLVPVSAAAFTADVSVKPEVSAQKELSAADTVKLQAAHKLMSVEAPAEGELLLARSPSPLSPLCYIFHRRCVDKCEDRRRGRSRRRCINRCDWDLRRCVRR